MLHIRIDGSQLRFLLQERQDILPAETSLTIKMSINLADEFEVSRGIHRPAQGAVIGNVVEQSDLEPTRGVVPCSMYHSVSAG